MRLSPQERRRRSRARTEANRAQSRDPDWRAATLLGNRKRSEKPEWRAAVAEGARKRSKDPAWKEAHDEAARKMGKVVHTCPHCGKVGTGTAMKRWHFDRCHRPGRVLINRDCVAIAG
jgi:hypothetical protein